ncbi:MerR family transcriptional regulator [Candidatus Foliamicus sp.]
MLDQIDQDVKLPPIPAKRHFTIGEVSTLCRVEQHVLRYWEKEFPQLNPTKRRGGRRYYQAQDIMLIRQIRHLLQVEGYTLAGARQRLAGEKRREDQGQLKQFARQMRSELEALQRLLK